MEDAGDDHTDEQYEQHDALPPHNPEIVQPGLSAEMRGPKRTFVKGGELCTFIIDCDLPLNCYVLKYSVASQVLVDDA